MPGVPPDGRVPWGSLDDHIKRFKINNYSYYLPNIIKTKPDKHKHDATKPDTNIKEVEANKINKPTHALNGNIEYKDLKVIQINTGNGKWCTNEEL